MDGSPATDTSAAEARRTLAGGCGVSQDSPHIGRHACVSDVPGICHHFRGTRIGDIGSRLRARRDRPGPQSSQTRVGGRAPPPRERSTTMKVTKSALVALFAFIVALVMASPASAVAAKFHSVDSLGQQLGRPRRQLRRAGARQRQHRLHPDGRRLGRLRLHQRRREAPAGRQQGDRERRRQCRRQLRVEERPRPGEPLRRPDLGRRLHLPDGQRLVLAAVSYRNIVLTDTTNGTSVSVPNTSRVFFAV